MCVKGREWNSEWERELERAIKREREREGERERDKGPLSVVNTCTGWIKITV